MSRRICLPYHKYLTSQKYIGKKLAKFKTTKPPLKGRKNKRRGYKESDWRTYYGSSDRLNADVAALGDDKFTREILYLCKGRGEMSYIEAREQFDRRVLETDDYYNGIINVRVGGSENLNRHSRTTHTGKTFQHIRLAGQFRNTAVEKALV